MSSNKTVFILLSFVLLLSSCTELDQLPPIPRTEDWKSNLSGYNVYAGNWSDLEPTEDYQLYELGSSLYTNHAEKQRLIKLPEGTEMIYNGNGLPEFPNGSIIVKTFYYYVDKRDPSLGKRVIETRLLVKRENLWNMATYVWNEEQNEATLNLKGIDTQVDWIDDEGIKHSISYNVPSEKECIACHQKDELATPIGPSYRNLNFEVLRNGTPINQLENFKSIGLMNNFNIKEVSQLPDFHDETLSLETRTRAYLDMNCAHCHQPGAWQKSSAKRFDFRYETSLENTSIPDAIWDITQVLESGEMPFLGVSFIDQAGVEMIIEYLNGL